MTEQELHRLLVQLQQGELEIEEAYNKIKMLPYEDLGFAKLDHHRGVRDNFPEVIYCPGKSREQIEQIFSRLAEQSADVLATRADEETFKRVQKIMPQVQYDSTARLLYLKRSDPSSLGQVAVITAGTSDLPVAEEAALTLELMGVKVERVYDAGVAGIHRLFDKLKLINTSQVVIVAAGMEGALASVVGGLTPRPVIAVPTSVGYGASFHGLAALLAMLNSCASGVAVVNIDNGFGAAAMAVAILRARD
jgi:pyridinium-3,5-biscarboxylic acid mononucleotide synthase